MKQLPHSYRLTDYTKVHRVEVFSSSVIGCVRTFTVADSRLYIRRFLTAGNVVWC